MSVDCTPCTPTRTPAHTQGLSLSAPGLGSEHKSKMGSDHKSISKNWVTGDCYSGIPHPPDSQAKDTLMENVLVPSFHTWFFLIRTRCGQRENFL